MKLLSKEIKRIFFLQSLFLSLPSVIISMRIFSMRPLKKMKRFYQREAKGLEKLAYGFFYLFIVERSLSCCLAKGAWQNEFYQSIRFLWTQRY